jgi:hypothetical protein
MGTEVVINNVRDVGCGVSDGTGARGCSTEQ